MKYFALICSLLLAVFFAAGYFIVLLFSEAEAKKEIREAILSGKLQGQYETFSFSESELKNLHINDGEFRLNDMLFDVITVEEHDGHFQVTCIADEKENRLVKQLASQLDGSVASEQVPHSGGAANNLLKFLESVYFMESPLTAASQCSEKIYAKNILLNYQSPFVATNDLPPEIMIS